MNGKEHPDTLAATVNLANTHGDQGRYAEAEKVMAVVLEVCQRVSGEEHPETLRVTANFAATCNDQV